MTYLTLDELIAKLQQLKASGIAGDIAVAIPSTDNNGRPGWVQRIEGAGRVAVAKPDIDKGYALCKTVAARGIDVIVIR